MTEYLATADGDIERPTDCWQGTDYRLHYSPECRKFGNGQCDGYCEPHGEECACPCHRDLSLPETVVEVEAWHHDFHDVVLKAPAAKPALFCWECAEDGNGDVEATESDDNGPLCEGCHGRRVEDGLIDLLEPVGCTEPCDGTGWTGNPGVRCTTHYEPNDLSEFKW